MNQQRFQEVPRDDKAGTLPDYVGHWKNQDSEPEVAHKASQRYPDDWLGDSDYSGKHAKEEKPDPTVLFILYVEQQVHKLLPSISGKDKIQDNHRQDHYIEESNKRVLTLGICGVFIFIWFAFIVFGEFVQWILV